MDDKRKYYFPALISLLLLISSILLLTNASFAKAKASEDWGIKEICSYLGGKEKHFHHDIDVYTFTGQKGEKVIINLQANPSGYSTGEGATLILASKFKHFFKVDKGSLANKISAVLPARGEYFVYVIEQFRNKPVKSFKGDYCLTLKSSREAWKTFQHYHPSDWRKHPITWIPEKIEETVAKGAAEEIKVVFISNNDLKKLNLWITPELRPFFHLEPDYFENIEANTPYEVTLRLAIPENINLGHYDGTIHLRSGHRTYPETLKVDLNIIENLPPVANAGPDQVIVLPAGQTTIDVQLDGRASYDPNGMISSYTWIGNPDPEDVANPTVKLKQGIHDFTLQVADNDGATSSDSVRITVIGPPLLMPLPAVIGEPTITIKGISVPGALIKVTNKNTGETKEVINGKGFFEIPFDLAPGANEFEAKVKIGDVQSAPATSQIIYSFSKNLHLDNISPPEGHSGSIITITGSGFTPDKKIMGAYFKGSETDGRPALEGKGIVLDASETILKVLVPFIFLKNEEDLEVYVHDGQNISNSLTFRVTPAQDPTPDLRGNEVNYQLDLILGQLQLIFNKLEQWTKPKVLPEKWVLIEENIKRTQNFLVTFKERVNSIPSGEVKGNLDAIFGGEFFAQVTQQLEQINEILSHTTPCDIARVIQILNQILEPINTLNSVLNGIKDTLIAIQAGNGIACFFGCVPCCAAIPFLYEVYSTVCAIDGVVDAIRSVFNTVIAMMNTTIPTIPSEWKVAVTGPFSGISNHILYTNTSNEIRLYANFTNAGFEQLIDMSDLRIDIPDPGGIFSILSFIGIDIEAAIEETLGRLLLDLAVDLLDIDEIRITFADINVGSVIRKQADPSQLVTIVNEGAFSESHIINAGALSGTGILLNIQASCGSYEYPSKTKCLRQAANNCVEWGTDYPPNFDMEVIPVPYIQNIRWEQINAWDPCCRYEPRGHYEGCWKDEFIPGAECREVNRWVNQPTCRYDSTLLRWVGCFECYDFNCHWVEDDPCIGCWKQKYNLVIEGKGFSSDYNTLRVYWNGELLTPANYGDLSYNSFNLYGRYEYEGYGTDYIGDKPGWISIGVQDSAGNIRDTYGWLTWFVPPSPDLDAELSFINSSLYPGDRLYVTGNYFTPYQADNLLELSYESNLFQIRPDQAWVEHRQTQADVLSFPIPPFHEERYSFEGKTLGATLKVGRDLPCQANNCDQETIKILPHESAGMTTADDQDAIILGGANNYIRSAAIGDINGDGINDLVVGVPEYRNSTGHAVGAVFIAFGPVQGLSQPYGNRMTNTIDLSTANPTWNVIILGDANDIHSGGNSRRVGNSLAIGDINGDGLADLLIGTTDQDEFGHHKPNIDLIGTTPAHVPGKAYILFGRENWNSAYHLSSGDYDVKFYGDNSRELGYQVGIGKIYGDGQYKDIVITAPTDSVNPNVPNNLVARVYIITGQIIEASFRQKKDVILPNDLFSLSTSYYSILEGKNYSQYNRSLQYKGDGLGKSLALGDINGDGLDDVVLGAPEFGGEPNALPQGAVYILYGRPWTLTPPLPGYYYFYAKDEGDQDAAIIGPLLSADDDQKTGFGSSVQVVDLNGDGKGEIIIGAPASKLVLDIYPSMTLPLGYQSIANIREPSIGQIYIIDGANPNLGGSLLINKNADYIADLIVNGSRSISRFGYSLASGDINKDGIRDLLIGAPGGRSGHVWVFYGDGRGKWRETTGQDVVHLENRRWYAFENPEGVIGWYDYSTNSGAPIEEGTDYLFIGPRKNQADVLGFGVFTTAGDLHPYVGEDVLIIDPVANAPNASLAGMIYVFYEGSQEPWPVINPPNLVIKPNPLDFGQIVAGTGKDRNIEIKNEVAGTSANLKITGISYSGDNVFQLDITNYPTPSNPWILENNQSIYLPVYFNPQSAGSHSGTITITSNDPDKGEKRITVTGTAIEAAAQIYIQPGMLLFDDSNLQKALTIENRGNAPLTWTIGYDWYQNIPWPSWLTVAPLSGETGPGASTTLNVSVKQEGLSAGTYVYNIYIQSNDPDSPNIPFLIVFTTQGEPALFINPKSFDLGYGLSQASFRVINSEWNCVDQLQWQINSNLPAWLTVSPASGNITNCGGTETITIQVNRSGLPVGEYTHTISITSNSGSGNVEIKMSVPPPIIISPVYSQMNLCGDEKLFAASGGIPPYSFELIGLNGEAVPDSVHLTDNEDGTATIRVTPCNLTRDTSAQAVNATVNEGTDFTNNLMAISLYRYILSDTDVSLVNVEQPVNTQCGANNLILQVTDSLGLQSSASITFSGKNNWSKTYGPWQANYIEENSDGGFIMGGLMSQTGHPYVSDIRITKLSHTGQIQWDKQISMLGTQDISKILQTSDGGYILLGGNLVIKLNSSGNIEWKEMVYGAILYAPMDQTLGTTSFSSVKETSDGGFILAGTMDIYIRDEDRIQSGMMLVKLNSDGSGQWWKFYHQGVNSKSGILDLELTSDGKFIGMGWVVEDTYLSSQVLPMLVKFDSSGNIEWTKRYESSYISMGFYSLALTSDDGYIIAGLGTKPSSGGGTPSSGGIPTDGGDGLPLPQGNGGEAPSNPTVDHLIVIKTDSDGTIQWQKEYKNVDPTWVAEIHPTDDNGYIIGLNDRAANQDAWIVKIDSHGDIVWQKAYGTNADYDALFSLQKTSDGGYIAAGSTDSFKSSDFGEAWVLKLGPDGNCNGCGQ